METYRYREQSGGCQMEGGGRGDRMDKEDQEVQTSTYKKNKSCGCNVQHALYHNLVWWQMATKLSVVISSQCIQMSNPFTVHMKLIKYGLYIILK